MKMISFLRKVLPLFTLVFLWSCDDEFSPVGSGIVGDENLSMIPYTSENLVAYNRATGAVQSNNLPINSLGVIDNGVFGKSAISFLTQLQFVTATNPTVEISNPTIKRVELVIPYFIKANKTEIDSEGNRTYVLDSLYGSANNKIKLNVYESGYYLRDFDPATNFEQQQKYYTDMYNDVLSSVVGSRLNNSDSSSQNDAFFFDKSEHIIYEENSEGNQVVKERIAPQMKIELDNAFFQQKIFNAPPGQMENNNTFANYFRGLFFQVEDLGQGSQMMQLDFSQGKINIYYDTPSMEEGEEDLVVLNLRGNTVSLVENQMSSSYSTALLSANQASGDEKLYIKGSEGSVAYLDLFANGNELEDLRVQAENENWLINEANLVFYIDKSQMDNLHPFVPQRIFLFNTKNNIPLLDYYHDASSVTGFPKLGKYIHDGFMYKGSEDGKGYFYKVRITKHIKELLKNPEAENIKIGIGLTETITQLAMASLKSGVGQPDTNPYRNVPAASVMNPLGTVLYGNNTTDTDKKLKLEILYTKP